MVSVGVVHSVLDTYDCNEVIAVFKRHDLEMLYSSPRNHTSRSICLRVLNFCDVLLTPLSN